MYTHNPQGAVSGTTKKPVATTLPSDMEATTLPYTKCRTNLGGMNEMRSTREHKPVSFTGTERVRNCDIYCHKCSNDLLSHVQCELERFIVKSVVGV